MLRNPLTASDLAVRAAAIAVAENN